jgi:hypothetical protein
VERDDRSQTQEVRVGRVYMKMRILIWALTLGFAGSVFADYSSHDTSLMATALGGVIGAGAGVVVALLIDALSKRRRSR